MTITSLDTYTGKFIAPADFARYLCVSQRAVYHWIAKGALPVLRIGDRTVRIPIEEARKFVDPSTIHY